MNKKEWQPLTIPRVMWNKQTLSATFGELVAEPLDPGFGMTLGNALRRVLLGSVEGSAVTAVTISGVNNEFSSLPGVVEDTMQVVLNIKDIVIHNKTGQPGTMRMRVEGESVATVAHIQADDHLELINKDHVIAHVAAGGVLDIEFTVESGRGYRVAKWPVGQAPHKDERIYLDAMFSPIKRVTFDVTKTRVGQDIDYDRLLLAVTTNGSAKPVDVIHYAVSVLRAQLEHFLTEVEIPFNEISAIPGNALHDTAHAHDALNPKMAELLLKPIDALEFSVRANNCLLNAGIKRIIDLVNLSEDDILKIKNFGRKSFEEVKEGMKMFGLSFGMNVNEESLKKTRKKDKE